MNGSGSACLLLLGAVLALGGCAPAAPAVDPTQARLEQLARASGLVLADPMALDEASVREIRRTVGARGMPLERLQRLDDWLRGGRGELVYVAGRHRDAQQAFDERRGDCMSYALLFRAAARSLGISTDFLHAPELLTHEERNGWFYVSSHVAVGYGIGSRAVVFDFADGRLTSWRLSPYEPIDDGTAMALHYSNVAASWMAAGRLELARRLLAVLADAAPEVPEPLNNLAVVESRLGHPEAALQLLGRALDEFPDYAPLYTNALHAALAAGQPELARELEARGQRVAEQDPFFLFARGVRLFQSRRFALAAKQFERASAAEPDSPVVNAWLARAYLSAGDLERGRDAWQHARELGPGVPLVREIERQFPAVSNATSGSGKPER